MTDPILFVDVEASGLHEGSYPTEIGWCSHDLRRGGSFLVRPTPDWAAGLWCAEAEQVTGISREMLNAFGLEPAAVAAALNEALAGTTPLTDNPAGDGRWLWSLFAAAGIEPAFGICPPPAIATSAHQSLWDDIRALHDVDVLVASVAGERGAGGWTAIEEAVRQVRATAGLIEHRALDDAIGHAVELGVVVILGACGENDAARDAALADLADRARILLEEAPRPGR